MTTIKCKAIVFDLDGTLVDSGDVVEKAWEQFAIANGFDFKEEVLPILHGRPAIATIKDLLPGKSIEELRALEGQLTAMELNLLDGLKPIVGADKLLALLPENSWGIATSGIFKLASGRLLSAGLPLPKVMVTADVTKNPKPHPEPFLKAMEELGYEPHECVVFEDSPAGIRGALASGATVVAINLNETVARELNPHLNIIDLSAITAVVDINGAIELKVV